MLLVNNPGGMESGFVSEHSFISILFWKNITGQLHSRLF